MVEKNKITDRNSDLLAILIAETLICAMIDTFISIPVLSVLITAMLVVALFVNNPRLFFIHNKSIHKYGCFFYNFSV